MRVKLKLSSLLEDAKDTRSLIAKKNKRERESKRTTKSKLSSFVPIVNDEAHHARTEERSKKKKWQIRIP